MYVISGSAMILYLFEMFRPEESHDQLPLMSLKLI